MSASDGKKRKNIYASVKQDIACAAKKSCDLILSLKGVFHTYCTLIVSSTHHYETQNP